MLTTNKAPAAQVLLTRSLLRRRLPLKAVLVNSGNANSATGRDGMEAARAVLSGAAKQCGLPASAVVMASTGIIGVRLPIEKILRALPRLERSLSDGGGRQVPYKQYAKDWRSWNYGCS